MADSQRDYWRVRGFRDGVQDRSPLFRSTRAYGIVPDLPDEVPSDWTDADIDRLGRAYLAGYDAGCEQLRVYA